MQTLTIQSEVTDEGKVKIEVPCDLPPGPVEVEVTIRGRGGGIVKRFDWDPFTGSQKGRGRTWTRWNTSVNFGKTASCRNGPPR